MAIIHKHGIAELCMLPPRRLNYTYCNKRGKAVMPAKYLEDISLYSEIMLQFISVAQYCPTLCDPMNHRMPGLPVHHQLLEFTQTHVHWVGDAIQPSHSLSSPSPPALNLSQPSVSFQMSQLFASGGQSIGLSASTSVLPMHTQDRSPLEWTGWISLQSKGPSRVFAITQFESINSSALSFLYSPTLMSIHDHWKNYSLD